MQNVADIIKAKLDEIGADGLMYTHPDYKWTIFYGKENEVEMRSGLHEWGFDLVPAYRHADGTYHTYKESPCKICHQLYSPCERESEHCEMYQSWLSHKEAAK